MEPPQEAEIDFSEIFANDKIAFNARSLNYWCARAARGAACRPWCRVPAHGTCARSRAETTRGARSRVFMAIVSGCASGIMGITGLLGFVVFFLTSLIMSVALYLMMDRDPRPYFKNGSDVWTDGVMQGMMVRPSHRALHAHCAHPHLHRSRSRTFSSGRSFTTSYTSVRAPPLSASSAPRTCR